MTDFYMRAVKPALIFVLLLLSPAVFALGLGNVTVESYLNQPLSARIELLVRPGEDISGVTARLATAEDYALIGASLDSIPVPLRFTVESQTDQPFVRVSSSLPINQPIVRLIIELNWASGRLLREYTLFLDPPTLPAAAPPPIIDQSRPPVAPVAEPPVTPPEQSMPESVDEDPAVADTEGSSASEPASDSARQFSGEDQFGPVQGGDTLWRIASDWSVGSGGSVNQVMLAIQRNNPQAFISNNINLLKRGAILRMPSSADIEAISVDAARNEVQEQAQLFSSRTSNQASLPVPQSTPRAVETPLVDVASEMSSSAPSDSGPGEDSQLEIVPPSEESSADSAYGAEDSADRSSASTSAVALQEELARKEEALITEQQTNEYLQQRIQELESRLDGSDAVPLLVEDEELADMEARLREQRQAEGTEEETPVQQPTPEKRDVPSVTSSVPPVQPWYQRWIVWVIGLLVLLAAGFGWYRSRSAGEEIVLATASREKTVRGIQDEAEEILKVLKPEAGAESVAGQSSADADIQADSGPEPVAEPAPVAGPRYTHARHPDHEEALVLDEDSADPEVRLDLARAYISMGDREAARAILGEVIEHGNDVQKAEAQAMLSGL